MRGKIPVVPLLFAAALHGLGLFGFNYKAAPKPVAVVEDLNQMIMVMPELEKLDDEEIIVDEGTEAPPLESADYVPMLADAPSVNFDSVFVQKMDFSSLKPRTDLQSAAIVTIPAGLRTGSQTVRGTMKNLFDLKDLDSAPTPVFQPVPVFPAMLKREVREATVLVEFIVNTKGKVVEAYVVEASYRGFEDAAIAGVSRWQFRPGLKGGRPVNTRMRVPLMFRVVED